MAEIILASASPRRIEMLKNIGIEFKVFPSNVDENSLDADTPEKFVCKCACLKAVDVAKKYPDAWVLGADTVVVLGSKIMGKPVDSKDAKKMLKELSGREHRVISAFCVTRNFDNRQIVEYVETRVRFKNLTSEEINGYVATGEPLDKAGAYGIQGIGSFLVKEIRGSYTNVVGLPLAEVLDVLVRFGIARPFEEMKG